jgi:hypothetical protein
LRQAGRTNVAGGNLRSKSSSEPEVCIANIGPKERRQRLAFGLFTFAVGVILAVVLVGLHLHPLWRLLLFFPFAGGASGYFQAAEKTWVNLAKRGQRNMDNGIEQIDDDTVLKQVRKQAQRVMAKSVGLGALLTLAALLLPGWANKQNGTPV